MKSTKISRFMGIGLTIALLTSLLTVAVPASALTQPIVTFTATTDAQISKADADYIVKFNLATQITTNTTPVAQNATITLTFPSDTTIPSSNATIAATLVAGIGWYNDGLTLSQIASVPGTPTITTSSTLRTITFQLPDGGFIGEGAEVRIGITSGITNPNTAGDYTLTVKTSKETTAVTSAVYTIVNPILTALPGVVSVYNPTGVLMGQQTGGGAIAAAIASAGENYVIKIGPGTYSEAVLATSAKGQTYVATGALADTIIKTTFTIQNLTTTLDGLTIQGAVVAAANTANSSVIKNSVIKAASATAATTLLDIGANSATTPLTVSNTTLELGAATLKGITSLDTNVVITGSTFKGIALMTSIESNNSTFTISGSTFTGAGTGIKLAAASSSLTVSTSTFSAVTTVLSVSSNSTTVQFYQNTITSPTGDAIVVNNVVTNGTILKGNTITGIATAKYALNVGAAATANVSMAFNNLTGNAGNVKAANDTVAVDAAHNWWGSASGPVSTTISGALVSTAPFLTGAVSSSTDLAINKTTLSAMATAGVDVDATLYAPTLMAAAKYAANPTASAPPSTALAGGYYDVFVAGPPAVAANSVVIKLYNTAIASTTQVYYWNGLQGKWLKASSQGNNLVNIAGKFTFVTATSTSTPSIADLSGTPFVLVTETPVAAAAITLANPAIGATNVVLKPVLSWTPYSTAIWYEVTMSEYPDFSIIEWSHNVGNGVALPPPTVYGVGTPPSTDETLKYGTTYFWRVRGVTAQPVVAGTKITVPSGPWIVGAFTTMAAPAAPPTQQVVITQPAPPPVTATVETTKEVLVPQPIPNWMLMTIIVIGAVLIIALIVLIVRTRRVA
jgi:hypothetical protein